MGILLIALIIGVIIIGVNWSKAKATNSEEQLEKDLVKSMKETKVENDKVIQLLTEIPLALNENGFAKVGVGFHHEDRVFSVQAEEVTFTRRNKKAIKKIIKNTTKENDFKNFKVEFLSMDRFKLSEEDIKLRESFNEISNLISKVLEENGYTRSAYSIKEEDILIEVTNADLVNKEVIETLIANSIFSKTNRHYTVTIKEQSKNQILDQQWQPIFDAIRTETEKNFKEYRGFAYSFHPKPLEIIIKTNLKNHKWFWNSDKSTDQIENYIEKIIALKRAELSIEEIPYEIIILDKKDKQMN
ncbi:hypothetical protein [Solibacillus sp. FSL K6-1523]|uniref:hypothetical protein n=1 Tax=Solibacillus sp. FSL K6-1523 TaxID=2921471 RepID=UPI0030F5A4E6